ncbi:MAG: serine hydrolase domain-containing protein [Solirubrobacterales bacterium]
MLVVTLAGLAGGATLAEAGKRLDRLQRGLERVVELPEGPPGASALIKRRGRVDFPKAGVANLETGAGYHRNDHFRIASTSKAFSGAVALVLVDHGVLSLESTIGEVLPDLPDSWSAVTLRQLLQHTGGIPSFTKSPEYLQTLSMNPAAKITPMDLIGFVADAPLKFPPGSAYEYSNTDNIVIALMAERAFGESYDKQLRDFIFSELKLKRTSLPGTLELSEPYVRGYDFKPPAPIEDVSELIDPSWVWASGALVSTPVDLTRFIRAYASGELITKRLRTQQRNFVLGAAGEPPGPAQNSGGLALYRYRTECGTVLGHSGNFPGYTTLMIATPNGRRSAVVTINEQLAEDTKPETFEHLRRVFELAACAALPR